MEMIFRVLQGVPIPMSPAASAGSQVNIVETITDGSNGRRRPSPLTGTTILTMSLTWGATARGQLDHRHHARSLS